MKVTSVHPGYVKTAIARRARAVDGVDMSAGVDIFDKIAITKPERAARIILNAVRKGRPRVLVGPDAKLFDLVVRMTGSGYQRLFLPLSRRMQPPTR